jgi:hypothetical protein
MDKYKEARLKYKPDKIKFLLVAESPPQNPERYFYFENMTKGDGFYLEIMNALYCRERFAPKFLRENKQAFLNCFKRDGFYLVDACEKPIESSQISYKKKRIKEALPDLKKRLSCLACPDTKIILIVASVYDVCFQDLKLDGFRVINSQQIPFPGFGNQNKFREKLIPLLQKYSWAKGDCNPYQ